MSQIGPVCLLGRHTGLFFIFAGMKPHMLFLHGAAGASTQLRAISAKLSSHYTVHLYDFPGHGGQPLPEEPFSIPFFAAKVAEHIRANQWESVTIFGASMGGAVGLYLAKEHPELVEQVITLGTKFHWDTATAEKEVKMLQPDVIAVKVPSFAAALEKMHAPVDWKQILAGIAQMMIAMGQDNPLQAEDLKTITVPALILLGDRDKMVSFDETVQVYKWLPEAAFGVLPNTPHPAELVNPDVISAIVLANQSSRKPIAG